ncbi:hypothetical protein GE253_00905 [Niveispirillum sp. SYP-B3756]|uniref:hypothetical protein n=1 Tax=Niveispirillum sp. SYP-B3756 TaxID=2662178 RepID=UPI001290E129|nr:hypothetical protein [Niveispirillum sp. SYP-B3756]MQP63894.1 hypothetical protein [Niveispirillum sp. SYP-B3756]
MRAAPASRQSWATMLSISKLITLIGILAIVWFGFRLVGKLQRQRQEALRRNNGNRPPQPPPRTGKGREPVMETEDMVKCPGCGVYIPANARKCGTPGCPQA